MHWPRFSASRWRLGWPTSKACVENCPICRFWPAPRCWSIRCVPPLFAMRPFRGTAPGLLPSAARLKRRARHSAMSPIPYHCSGCWPGWMAPRSANARSARSITGSRRKRRNWPSGSAGLDMAQPMPTPWPFCRCRRLPWSRQRFAMASSRPMGWSASARRLSGFEEQSGRWRRGWPLLRSGRPAPTDDVIAAGARRTRCGLDGAPTAGARRARTR
jgi:hypothetical protein